MPPISCRWTRAWTAEPAILRIHPLKEDTFVLDFVNDREEIREAFKIFYEGAIMGDEVDPARMYQIKAELDASGIYLDEECERFCKVYFKPK